MINQIKKCKPNIGLYRLYFGLYRLKYSLYKPNINLNICKRKGNIFNKYNYKLSDNQTIKI